MGWWGGRLYIARLLDSTSHNDDLLGPEEGLRVLSGSQGHVGQGSNRNDGYGLGVILTQDTENLLVSGTPRGNKGLGAIFLRNRLDPLEIGLWLK